MNKQELIESLNALAPKNPKGEWGKMQRDIVDEAMDMLSNAVIIPNDATNGDVMKLIFPNAVVTQSSGLHNGFIFAPSIYMTFDNNEDRTFQFGYFWWNEKYFKTPEEPKPLTRDEMEKKIDDYCEGRQDCKGCPIEKLCEYGLAVSKWKDEELKQAIEIIKAEENKQ